LLKERIFEPLGMRNSGYTHRELIVLLDNSDSPRLLDIALEIRRVLARSH